MVEAANSVVDNKPVTSTVDNKPVVFNKPGQRYATPSPGNGERVFYESLFEQKPDSEMAQEYVVSYGVLDEKQAAEVYAAIMARKARASPNKKAGR